MDVIFRTPRLYLRKLTPEDRLSLCETLQDGQAMYAYEHAFSETEVDEWLDRQLARYRTDGFGLWALIRSADGAFLGQCGITMQSWGERRVPEIGYMLARRFWHNGYMPSARSVCPRCTPSSAKTIFLPAASPNGTGCMLSVRSSSITMGLRCRTLSIARSGKKRSKYNLFRLFSK